MIRRRSLHWFVGGSLIVSGALFALVTWWPPLTGHTAAPDERISFSTSPVFSSCDANRDGRIDAQDVSILKLYWKGFPQREIDCNQDGYINGRDLAILMADWTGSVPVLDAGAIPSAPGATDSPTAFQIAIPSERAAASSTVGSRFTALIVLSGGGLNIGAGEVVLSYNADRVAVRSVRTSPSIWTMWTERPHPPYGRRLVFSGGRPKGFSGPRSVIAEIEFEVLAVGDEGLRILEESRAYQSDSAGTQLPLSYDDAPSIFYDGAPPISALPTAPQSVTTLVPISAPTPLGPRWMVDFSVLAKPSDIPTFEIEDGSSRSIQHEDAYVLLPASLESHELVVLVHGADGQGKRVSVNVLLPGRAPAPVFWERLVFWIVLELGLACVLCYFIFRRRK